MINRELINGRLLLISDYLSQLEKLSQLSKEDFYSDKRNSAAAESFFRRTLEAIFDVGRHILAKTGGVELASEYKSIAKGLGGKSIIDPELSNTLIQMAGYRNRLVHLYHLISEEELYDIISNHLDDIEQFIIQVQNYVNENK